MEHTVTLRRVASYEDTAALAQAVDAVLAASPKAAALGPHSRVLLKPNLLARHAPGAAVTTHPALVRAAIQALHRRGVAHITLADSPGGPYAQPLMQALYKTSGLAAVCQEEGVTLWMETGSALRPAPKGKLVREFALIDPVLQADFILNLPKLKTHMMTGLSCGVKNLFGCVPGLRKAEFHMQFPQKEKFGEMLADLAQLVAPALTIVDGVVAMEGDGPAGGVPRPLGLVLGGEDPFALDLAACRIIGIAPQRVPYLAAGIDRGACPSAIPDAWLDDPAALCRPKPGFALPSSYHSTGFDDNVPAGLRWATPLVQRFTAPRPKINRKKCVGCGQCRDICPASVITVEKGKAAIAPKECIHCFCCHEVCPVKAIDVKRFSMFRL